MTDKQFPLVSDDEIMLTEMPHMNLYDELDLISNITGDYTDRNYLEWMPIVDSNRHAPIAASQAIRRPLQKQSASKDFKKPIDKKDPAIRYAEQAREEARADLKKKRSASYLTSDLPNKMRKRKVSTTSNRDQSKPTALFQKNTVGEFSKFGDKMSQETYILADVPMSPASQPKEEQKQAKKNNYDFLKNSQIYNKEKVLESQSQHAKAQELDLTNLNRE